MKLSIRVPRTLAIVGNGFDLTHGYNTDYKSFVESTASPWLDIFKNYCESGDIPTWFAFEENIRLLSEKLFFRSMSENQSFEDSREDLRTLTKAFSEIHKLLCKYLRQEISGKPLKKNPGISKYLDKNTAVLNFNYTGTVEAYTSNVIYVHGSLEEDDILLGYDYRDEPCLAQYEDMRWSKTICRESLAFRRHISRKKKRGCSDRSCKTLISSLESIRHWENTGRGLDDEIKKTVPKYRTVQRFLKKYRKRFSIPGLNYRTIDTVILLGHGIEADKVFLSEIIGRCTQLKRVIIFRYAGESKESLARKASFFSTYCKDIEVVDY